MLSWIHPSGCEGLVRGIGGLRQLMKRVDPARLGHRVLLLLLSIVREQGPDVRDRKALDRVLGPEDSSWLNTSRRIGFL